MLAAMHSRTKLFACLIGIAAAVPALAQSGTVTQYPACADPPPKLSQTELDAAHASYRVGVEAYDTGNYQKALDNFQDSFRRDCSKVALLNFIARAYEGRGDRAEAIHALETYLQRNPKAADAETVQNRIQNLRALMQQQSSTATATTVTPTATVTVTATSTAVPTATATPTAEEQGHTAGPWVLISVGAAAAIAGVVVTLVGQGAINKSQADCLRNPSPPPDFNCPPLTGFNQKDSDAKRGSDESTGLVVRGTGIVVTIVGGVSLISGIIWHFVEPTGPKKTAWITPVVAPGYGGIVLGAKF